MTRLLAILYTLAVLGLVAGFVFATSEAGRLLVQGWLRWLP